MVGISWLKKIFRIGKYLFWSWPYKSSVSKFRVNVISFDETVNLILKKKVSVSRFGDGEFRFLLSEDSGNTFEINSDSLSKELMSVLRSDNNQLLICIPSVYDGVPNLKFIDKVYWKREVSIYLKQYYKYLNCDYSYGDAFFSRPYQEYSLDNGEVSRRFDKLKEIWNKRDILIVEGELTRFGVGNDLLDNANSIKRILAPTTNAFEKIDTIYKVIKKEIVEINNDNILVLLSLGPTATILSSKLSSNLGIQAVDIGHLDIEYEWFIKGANEKVPIEGKYVNESIGKKYVDGKIDKKYASEIDFIVK